MSETSCTSIINFKIENDLEGNAEKNFDHDNVVDILQTCRACACVNNYFIPIYDGEGVEHELGAKINQYLPINVSETDELPTQLCYQCASLLITWHEMFIGSLKAEEDLLKLKSRLDNEKSSIPEHDEGVYQQSEEEEMDSSPVLIPEQEVVVHSSEPIIIAAKPIGLKIEDTHFDSANDDSQDFHSLVELREEECLKNDALEPKEVELKFIKIKPSKLPDYSNFMVCKLCGECINTNETPMADHEKNVHGVGTGSPSKVVREKSLSCVCEYCGKAFSSVKKASYHRRYTHMNATPGSEEASEKICELCGAVLKSSKKLREHKRNRHIVTRSHECVVCSMAFKLKETLVNHQRCAHNVFVGEKYQPASHRRRSYACFMCGTELASKFSLRRHLLIKHEHNTEEKWSFKVRTYECNHCDRIFKNKISFLRHQDKVLDGKLEKRFNCDLCPKGFFCHTDYIRHYRTHK